MLPPIHKMHLGFTLHDSCKVSNHFVFVLFVFLNTKLHNLVKAKGKCYTICAKKQVPVPIHKINEILGLKCNSVHLYNTFVCVINKKMICFIYILN